MAHSKFQWLFPCHQLSDRPQPNQAVKVCPLSRGLSKTSTTVFHFYKPLGPLQCNIHIKIIPSHLCMKILYFLYVFACAMTCILYLLCGILFPVGTLITFSDKHQLWCGCQGETSSEKISDNIIEGGKGPKELGCLYFQGRESLWVPLHFCPALTKLALDLHVNFCVFVCLSVCLSGLFFKASNWMIYWLLTVVLAPYLSD